jgi:hypothetical protein
MKMIGDLPEEFFGKNPKLTNEEKTKRLEFARMELDKLNATYKKGSKNYIKAQNYLESKIKKINRGDKIVEVNLGLGDGVGFLMKQGNFNDFSKGYNKGTVQVLRKLRAKVNRMIKEEHSKNYKLTKDAKKARETGELSSVDLGINPNSLKGLERFKNVIDYNIKQQKGEAVKEELPKEDRYVMRYSKFNNVIHIFSS